MANDMLEIVNGFSMYRHLKSAFLQVNLNFELEYMNVSSRHSISNFTYHIVIYWSLFKV